MARIRDSTRRAVSAIGVLVVLLVIAGVPTFLSTPARGASFTLWGSANAGGGWGFTQATVTSPGPLLVVTQGERVDLSLHSADGSGHTWCVDYGGDGTCTPCVDGAIGRMQGEVEPLQLAR